MAAAIGLITATTVAYELARRIAFGIRKAGPKLIAGLGEHLAPDAPAAKKFANDSL